MLRYLSEKDFDVIFDYNKGNHMRRCPSVTVSKDLQKLYDGINKILDDK